MAGDIVSGPKTEQEILNSVYDATNKVLNTNSIVAADIEIGAVELKDAGTDNRADINDASAAKTVGTHVLSVQVVDSGGTVLDATPTLGAGNAVIGYVNASQVTSPWITNASIVTASNVIGKLIDDAGTVNGVTLNTLISGEDQTNNRMMVEHQYSYSNVTASGATAVKTAAGFLHSLTFNTPASGVTTVITDSSAAGGTLIGTVAIPAGATNGVPFTLVYDVKCLSGITLSQVSGAATGNNITVSFR